MLDPPDHKTYCDRCDDTGLVPCQTCGGDGTVPNDCQHCLQADGTRHGGCWECPNDSETACDTCDGRGDVLCRDCPTCRHCGGYLRDGGHHRCWRIDQD